jgi:GMP synthase (glutamine-hydrolysing)
MSLRRFLLLQARNPDDPMREHEIQCFARALEVPIENIRTIDVLHAPISKETLSQGDILLLGGSGHYSIADGGPWLPHVLDVMRTIYDLKKPTFASCWGFQAFALALGGDVQKIPSKSEVGTYDIYLTDDAKDDHLFRSLPTVFPAQNGHEDHVVTLPKGAVRLAYSDLTENQAYTFPDHHIYCTQFHPELDRANLSKRLEAYPEYVEKVSGLTPEIFNQSIQETPESNALIKKFAKMAEDYL